MQIRYPGEPLPAPNCCFICEQYWPTESNTRMIDTYRDFEPAAITSLTGRKLICEHCATEAAHLLEFVTKDKYESVLHDLEERQARLVVIENSQLAMRNIKEVAFELNELADRVGTGEEPELEVSDWVGPGVS